MGGEKGNKHQCKELQRGLTAQYWEGQMVMLHFTVTGFYSRGSQPAASTAGFTPGQRRRLDVRERLMSVAFFFFCFFFCFDCIFLVFFQQNIWKQPVSRSLRHTYGRTLLPCWNQKKSGLSGASLCEAITLLFLEKDHVNM